MLKNLLAILFSCAMLIIKPSAQAQELTLNQLVSMYEGDYDEVNSTLLPKGWIFKGTDTEIDSIMCGEMIQASWAYQLDGETDKARSFVNYSKSDYCISSLSYQMMDVGIYNRIRTSIAKIGMRRTDSRSGSAENNDVTESYVASDFEGARFRITLSIVSYRNDEGTPRNYYIIFLRQKPTAED